MNLEDRDLIKRLEALHPELEPEVALDWFQLNLYWRVSLDGKQVQRRDHVEDPWRCTDSCPDVARLYRAGLAQGQKQALELAEAVLHGSRWTDTSRLARAILEAAE